jgi:hypothetical protein
MMQPVAWNPSTVNEQRRKSISTNPMVSVKSGTAAQGSKQVVVSPNLSTSSELKRILDQVSHYLR